MCKKKLCRDYLCFRSFCLEVIGEFSIEFFFFVVFAAEHAQFHITFNEALPLNNNSTKHNDNNNNGNRCKLEDDNNTWRPYVWYLLANMMPETWDKKDQRNEFCGERCATTNGWVELQRQNLFDLAHVSRVGDAREREKDKKENSFV